MRNNRTHCHRIGQCYPAIYTGILDYLKNDLSSNINDVSIITGAPTSDTQTVMVKGCTSPSLLTIIIIAAEKALEIAIQNSAGKSSTAAGSKLIITAPRSATDTPAILFIPIRSFRTITPSNSANGTSSLLNKAIDEVFSASAMDRYSAKYIPTPITNPILTRGITRVEDMGIYLASITMSSKNRMPVKNTGGKSINAKVATTNMEPQIKLIKMPNKVCKDVIRTGVIELNRLSVGIQ